ncbi:electron transfer flavoprotein subunit alpha/FixB family protein [Chloroflexota bacterium]
MLVNNCGKIIQDRRVYVIAEQRAGELQSASFELMERGGEIASKWEGELYGIVIGSSITGLGNALSRYGADKIYVIDSSLLERYSGKLYAEAILNIIEKKGPQLIMFSATSTGNVVAPHLAAMLQTGFISNCVALRVEKGELLCTKPTYGGKIYSTVIGPQDRPWIVTLRAGKMPTKQRETSVKTEVVNVSPQLSRKDPTKVVDFLEGDLATLSLDEAEIIVAGGRGVGNASNFKLVEQLAEVLGGQVGASRAAVDLGLASSGKLIGLTGKTVGPRLYIACGISGTSYHSLGMKDSEVIVAINTDRNAPIFKFSDVAIIEDIEKVIPVLVKKLRQFMESSGKST